uniref:G-protein coupled receptors family 1 profile domain-containing protein n=1 Tax=Pongo abelii TaxID=9601 RepID=A0A8I5SZT1_PONAB
MHCTALLLHFVGASEMFLLTVMAFDRYAAICRPLHYATIMNPRLCCILVALSWMGGFIHSIIQVALIVRLPFCGPNELDSYFCDITQVVRIACANTFPEELVMICSSGLISVVCFIALLMSYAFLLALLKKHSGSGRRNEDSKQHSSDRIYPPWSDSVSRYSALGLCADLNFLPYHPPRKFPHHFHHKVRPWPHSPPLFLSGQLGLPGCILLRHCGSPDVGGLPLCEEVIFPLMNPMIYTLRNQEVKTSMKRLLSQHVVCQADFIIRN